MGQYYKTVLVSVQSNYEKNIVSVDNDCQFQDWVGLKLMEHSYLNNEWTDAIAKLMFENHIRMAHVGDYADEYPQFELAYNENVKRVILDISKNYDEKNNFIRFDYTGKYLVNYSKNIYISFDEYKQKSHSSWSKEVYVCPFTLLTALGNGRGGGDYYEEYPNADLVGAWAWDEIAITQSQPEGFTKSDVFFTENEVEVLTYQACKLKQEITEQKRMMDIHEYSDDCYFSNGRHRQDEYELNSLKQELSEIEQKLSEIQKEDKDD